MPKASLLHLIVSLLLICCLLLPYHYSSLPDAGIDHTKRFERPQLQPNLSLGRDHLGRSLAPRLLLALSTSLNISLSALFLSSLLAILLALLSFLLPKAVAPLPTQLSYIVFIVPTILLSSSLKETGLVSNIVLIISLTLSSLFVLVQQANSILRHQQHHAYWLYTLSSGSSTYQRVKRHQLKPLIIGLTPLALTRLSSLIILESTLSFLGLGLNSPMLSLGQLLHEGLIYVHSAPYLFFIPALSFISLIFLLQWIGLMSLSILKQPRTSAVD